MSTFMRTFYVKKRQLKQYSHARFSDSGKIAPSNSLPFSTLVCKQFGLRTCTNRLRMKPHVRIRSTNRIFLLQNITKF